MGVCLFLSGRTDRQTDLNAISQKGFDKVCHLSNSIFMSSGVPIVFFLKDALQAATCSLFDDRPVYVQAARETRREVAKTEEGGKITALCLSQSPPTSKYFVRSDPTHSHCHRH